MATRNINLPDALDRFVAEKVASGSYQNASEVVRAGLRLLQDEEALRAERIKRLNAEVRKGVADVDAGRYEDVPLDKLDAWFDGVEKEARTKVARRKK
jgi:antitoxin ParD1/3/4